MQPVEQPCEGRFSLQMSATACPFCGVVTDVPHESQEGCIEALQSEIARVREILETSRPVERPVPPPDGEDG